MLQVANNAANKIDTQLIDILKDLEVLANSPSICNPKTSWTVKKDFLNTNLEINKHEDRKSTRLNSSHANISYAVFCLKKKKQILTATPAHSFSTLPAHCRHPSCARPQSFAPTFVAGRAPLPSGPLISENEHV